MRLSRLLLVGILCAATMLAADPQIGTWTINIEKSKLTHPAAWKGRKMIIEPAGADAVRITFEQPLPNGEVQRRVNIRSAKENPGGNSGETSITQRIDEHHRRTIFKKDGKQVGTIDSTVSEDGKTMTNLFKGTDSKGNPIDEVRVFDKQ